MSTGPGWVRARRHSLRLWCSVVLLSALPPSLCAEPSTTGQSGLINMPDARIEEDGTLRLGYGYFEPYVPLWSSVTLLPWLEVSGRYTRITGIPMATAPDSPWVGYGDYKDKAFDAKLRLLRESQYWPSVAIGVQDYLGDARRFPAEFVALSKRFKGVDLTVGYGTDRIDGVFGGARIAAPWSNKFSFVVEYDANDYRNDFAAAYSGTAQRAGGWTYGVEYKWGWLGTQLAYQDGEAGVNAYVSIPLMRREFVPKVDEPAPYRGSAPRVTVEGWNRDVRQRDALIEALEQQGFGDVQVALEGRIMTASLTHGRITEMGRAVGRAARTILAHSPADTRAIRITYTSAQLPLVVYTFHDLGKLQDHLDGLSTVHEAAEYITVDYATPAAREQVVHATGSTAAPRPEMATDTSLLSMEDGQAMLLKHEAGAQRSFSIAPQLGTYFNDPSGAFHYDFFLSAAYSERLTERLYLNSAARLTVAEDLSEITQESNSTLPHVRSDVAEYRKGGRLRLLRLLLNRYFQPSERLYARASAGIYEDMFAGTGGQVLYLPAWRNWAFDVSVDWVRQRDTGGGFEFRDYSTVTALGALHYRFRKPEVTATLRAGRFLARDEGVRFELKRRFRSGVEIGAWYTITNGDDITSPGSPSDPYYDKGIYLSIALNALLTKDTRATSNFSLAPWTRDVGQMVASPGDLYRMVEGPLFRDLLEQDGLLRLNDAGYSWPEPQAKRPAGEPELMPLTAEMIERRETAVMGVAISAPDLSTDVASYQYRVGMGDTLDIVVWEHPELTLASGRRSAAGENGRVVAADGTIFFPYAGTLAVAGKTVEEIRAMLRDGLASHIHNPQVTVSVAEYRSQKIQVAGEVKRPGPQGITNVPLTVLDAIGQAGGTLATADLHNVMLHRDGVAYGLDLQALYEQGAGNWLLQAGDVLYVPDSYRNRVFVLGEMVQPGTRRMNKGQLTLAEALTEAGGIDKLAADVSRIYVIRDDASRKAIYKLNANSPDALALASHFALQPDDIVYVATADIVRWNRTLQQIVPTLQTMLFSKRLID